MVLRDIIATEPLHLEELISGKYWTLTKDYYAKFITDEGTYHLRLLRGWVTDKRSGSSIIDPIIPKWSKNIKYQAVISAHDCSYSGWISKSLADNLFIYQGMYMSGEVNKIRSSLAYYGVAGFGNSGYYNMDDDLPYPYQDNHNFESLVLLDK